MIRYFLALFLIVFGTTAAFCAEVDYKNIYSNLQVPNFSYMHGIDPEQYYDDKDATYSIYPLFRLCTPLYFKNISIPPGYYALTPRTYKGNEYLFFKDSGVIRYIIPVYKKDFVPEGFYESHLPKPKLTKTQKIRKAFYGYVAKHKKSMRRPEIQSYLEINDLDDKFVSVVVYYGPYRYYTIFRTVQL